MKVAIIHYVAGLSAKELQTALINNGVKCDVFRLSETHKRDFREYDFVFAYGCGAATNHNNRINSFDSTLRCIDKPSIFDCLKKAKVSTVEYCLRKQDIPKHWDWVVIRNEINGRKAEGLEYHANDGNVPDGKLFSEYFEHKYEYRIMVFRDEIVGRYFKRDIGGDWFFNLQPEKGFEQMDAMVLSAAKALKIDYVGFDVVAKTKKDFRILEANSGPRLTDEAENAIVEYFINL